MTSLLLALVGGIYSRCSSSTNLGMAQTGPLLSWAVYRNLSKLFKTYQMYSNMWLSDCWGPSSPRNISMDIHGLAGRQAWFTDGGRGQSYVGSHGKMRRFSWCRCWISQHCHTMSAMFEERVFMYLYVFLWIDQCGPQVSPKIISNLVLSDEDVRYCLVHLRICAHAFNCCTPK